MVGTYAIRDGNIVHMKSGIAVATIETGVPDPAALILDAVRIGKAGPFELSQRNGRDVILMNGKSPLDALPLIRAALKA